MTSSAWAVPALTICIETPTVVLSVSHTEVPKSPLLKRTGVMAASATTRGNRAIAASPQSEPFKGNRFMARSSYMSRETPGTDVNSAGVSAA
jgi:hypothetical protein